MATLQISRILTLLAASAAALLTIAPPAVSGQAYDYGTDINERLAIRQAQTAGFRAPHVVRGQANTTIFTRKEIRELQEDEDVWTLYMLGLNYLQFSNQTVPTSWYGITVRCYLGIHGIPHKTWAGVGPTPGNEETGYCTHSSILFPTWHRPYLALYEQVLYDTMMQIASMWPAGAPRQRYQAAVARFRIPYWDWATQPPSGQSSLPLSVGGSPMLNISGPYGIQPIANPLYSYTFKPLNAAAFIQTPWDIWTTTLRSPTTNDTTAISNNSLVAFNLDTNGNSLRQRLFTLMSTYSNYSQFSNNAWIPYQNPGAYDSLESLHDTIHNLAGGGGRGQANTQGGHMAFIPYSAFDPIFFLHHCNVDRLLALWQSIWPDSWVAPTPAALPSFTTSRGEIQDDNTALTPFFASDDGTFWTSVTVRDYTVFGYTYPELAGSFPVGGAQLNVSSIPISTKKTTLAARRVKRAINRLYGQSTPSGMFLKEMTARKKYSGQGGYQGSDSKASAIMSEKGSKPRKGVVFVGSRYREWIANVHVNKQALDGPFSIYFFLGPEKSISPDPDEWASAPNHVGTMGVFAAPPMAMADGSDMHDVSISGTVPLTTRLIEKVMAGELDSLEPRDVKRYLWKNLKKRIVTNDGKVVAGSNEEIRRFMMRDGKNFGVKVVSAQVNAPETEDELPHWGAFDVEFDMT